MCPSVKYIMGKEKEFGESLQCKSFLKSKAKPPPKQSVKFKCQIWPEITKKFTKECLDVSSLRLSRKRSA